MNCTANLQVLLLALINCSQKCLHSNKNAKCNFYCSCTHFYIKGEISKKCLFTVCINVGLLPLPSVSDWLYLLCGSRGIHCIPHGLFPASGMADGSLLPVVWWSSLWSFAGKHTRVESCFEFHWASKPEMIIQYVWPVEQLVKTKNCEYQCLLQFEIMV